ncbi:hypothetical protein QWZ13_11065 [Reinekea marina]|uniref:hypothetical protein n=1 Tax=Reinekea marina TaxID=1310421 RepID=UPI0025B288C3|nr:hypothetical protein [Reinekea marina]MDN3649453.1 hypothetical protein [Reinekea marina]
MKPTLSFANNINSLIVELDIKLLNDTSVSIISSLNKAEIWLEITMPLLRSLSRSMVCNKRAMPITCCIAVFSSKFSMVARNSLPTGASIPARSNGVMVTCPKVDPRYSSPR